MALIRCPECNKEISDQAIECPSCGYPLRKPKKTEYISTSIPKKSRLTAILLAILLGDFGAHKFYLNQTKQGIWYLLFFWTLIPAILSLFEAIGYSYMDDEVFQIEFGFYDNLSKIVIPDKYSINKLDDKFIKAIHSNSPRFNLAQGKNYLRSKKWHLAVACFKEVIDKADPSSSEYKTAHRSLYKMFH